MDNQGPATPKKPMTKTEIVATLSEATELTKDQVNGLLEELAKLIGRISSPRDPVCLPSPAC